MNYDGVKLRHLRTFIEVARQNSISRAASILSVSQPAVTRTINELEALLGEELLRRDGRGIRLSLMGEIFLHHAGASVAALRRGTDAISQSAKSLGVPVRVGALPTVSARVMPKAVETFIAANSGGRLSVTTGDNNTLFAQLRNGDLDLVVGRLAAPETMAGFKFEHLYSERVIFAVRAQHPLLQSRELAYDRLADYPILMPTRRSIIRPIVDRLLISLAIGDFPNQIETVSDSFGRAFLFRSDAIWIISEGVVANDLQDGRLQRLPIDTSETLGAVGLTTLQDQEPSLPLKILIEAIKQWATET